MFTGTKADETFDVTYSYLYLKVGQANIDVT